MTDNKNRGRPPLSQSEPTVKRTVTLTESQAKFLKLYGDGNTSRGVQWLVDEKREPKPVIMPG